MHQLIVLVKYTINIAYFPSPSAIPYTPADCSIIHPAALTAPRQTPAALNLVPYLDTLTIAEPTAIMVNTFGNGKMKDMDIVGLSRKHFDLTPKGIIEPFDLRRPIFRKTAAYGHFERITDALFLVTWVST
jgi:hypothetical protein